MSRTQVFKVIYAGIAIFGTYVAVARFMEGEWGWALLPVLVVVFSVYRLYTLEEG